MDKGAEEIKKTHRWWFLHRDLVQQFFCLSLAQEDDDHLSREGGGHIESKWPGVGERRRGKAFDEETRTLTQFRSKR